MTKNELRDLKRGRKTSAGDAGVELTEIQKLQCKKGVQELETFSATCTEVFTLICC